MLELACPLVVWSICLYAPDMSHLEFSPGLTTTFSARYSGYQVTVAASDSAPYYDQAKFARQCRGRSCIIYHYGCSDRLHCRLTYFLPEMALPVSLVLAAGNDETMRIAEARLFFAHEGRSVPLADLRKSSIGSEPPSGEPPCGFKRVRC